MPSPADVAEILAILDALDEARTPYQVRNGRLMLHKNAQISDDLAALVETQREALGALVEAYQCYLCHQCGGLVRGTIVEDGGNDYHPHCAPESKQSRQRRNRGTLRGMGEFLRAAHRGALPAGYSARLGDETLDINEYACRLSAAIWYDFAEEYALAIYLENLRRLHGAWQWMQTGPYQAEQETAPQTLRSEHVLGKKRAIAD